MPPQTEVSTPFSSMMVMMRDTAPSYRQSFLFLDKMVISMCKDRFQCNCKSIELVLEGMASQFSLEAFCMVQLRPMDCQGKSIQSSIEALNKVTTVAEGLNLIWSKRAEANLTNCRQWLITVASFLKIHRLGSVEAMGELLITLCNIIQRSRTAAVVSGDFDFKRQVIELGDRLVEGYNFIKQSSEFANLFYAVEAAFYLYVASLSISTRGARENSNDAVISLALAYFFSTQRVTFDSDYLAKSQISVLSGAENVWNRAQLLNANTKAVSAALLEQFHINSGISEDMFKRKLASFLSDYGNVLKRTMSLTDPNASLTRVLHFSGAMLCLPSQHDILALFEPVLRYEDELATLVWCILQLRYLKFDDMPTFIIGHLSNNSAIVKSTYPTTTTDFASTRQESLCQVDMVTFLLLSAARLDGLEENVVQRPPFINTKELLSANQVEWWNAVFSFELSSSHDNPFGKSRLIRDGLASVRLANLNSKVMQMATQLAETFSWYVLSGYPLHCSPEHPPQISLEFRRFHIFCCKYWEALITAIQNLSSSSGSSSSGHIFEPMPAMQRDVCTISPHLRRQIVEFANAYLAFDSYQGRHYEQAVRLLKKVEQHPEGIALTYLLEAKCYEAMTIDGHGSQISGTFRNLLGLALSAYEHTVNMSADMPRLRQIHEAALAGLARLRQSPYPVPADQSDAFLLTVSGSRARSGVRPSGHVSLSNGVGAEDNHHSPSSIAQSATALEAVREITCVRDMAGQMKEAVGILRDTVKQLSDVAGQFREGVVRMEAASQHQNQLLQILEMLVRERPVAAAQPLTHGGYPHSPFVPVPVQSPGPLNPASTSQTSLGEGMFRPQPAIIIGGAAQMPPPLFPSGVAFQGQNGGDKLFSNFPPSALQPSNDSAFKPPQQPKIAPLIATTPTAPSSKPSGQPQQPRKQQATAVKSETPITFQPQTTGKPQPSKPISSDNSKPLSDLFRPPESNWKCDACLVSNLVSAATCVCCQAPKPVSTEQPRTAPAPSEHKPLFPSDMFKFPTKETKTSNASPSPLITPVSVIPPKVSGKPAVVQEEGGEEEANPEEFVPTAEYKPIVELPKTYDVVTGEEGEESLFSERAKLYRWDVASKEWKERGTGDIKVWKNKESGKYRIVMRREHILKPCANHYITPELELKSIAAVGDRGFAWTVADFSEGEIQVMNLAVRFRNADFAQAFKKIVEQCKQGGVVAETEKFDNRAKGGQSVSAGSVTSKLGAFPSDNSKTATSTWTLSSTTFPANPATQSVQLNSPMTIPFTFNKTSSAPVFGTGSGGPGGPSSFADLAGSVRSGEQALTSSAMPPLSFGSSQPKPFAAQPLFRGMAKGAEAAKAATSEATSDQSIAQKADESEEVAGEPEEFVSTAEYKPVCELPADYKVVSGEEGSDRVFTSDRCKLYRWNASSNEWKERGIGELKLLRNKDSGRHRLVMRREQIHTVCANHYLSANTTLSPLPSAADRACKWQAVDYSDGDAKLETFCVKFKSPASAKAFSDAFEKAVKTDTGDKREKTPPKLADSSNTPTITPKVQLSEKKKDSSDETFKPTSSTTPPQPLFSFKQPANGEPPMVTSAVAGAAAGFRFGEISFGKASPVTPKPDGNGIFGGSNIQGFKFTPKTDSNPAVKSDDNDCVLTQVDHATTEEVAQAQRLGLPDDFYLYRLRKDCKGCRGCENCSGADGSLNGK